MDVNCSVVATVAAPIIAPFVGRLSESDARRRPRLIAYFTHLGGADRVGVQTHGIVIRNIGRRPATDVRVRHNYLPQDFNVFPDIERSVLNLPGGGAEIVFPALVPKEQVSIAYLYFPPVVYNQIHSGVRHSDGFATEVTALPTPQYPPWLRRGTQPPTPLGTEPRRPRRRQR